MAEQDEWTRWADEGGKQVRFTRLPNGAIRVGILDCDGTLQGTTVRDEATLANFRVAQLPDWVQNHNMVLLLLQDAAEALRGLTGAKIGGLGAGYSYIGWYDSEGPTASQRQAKAREVLTRLEAALKS